MTEPKKSGRPTKPAQAENVEVATKSELCKFKNATWIIPKPCENCDSPERVGSNWQWQHTDKLNEIDGKDGV